MGTPDGGGVTQQAGTWDGDRSGELISGVQIEAGS